MENGEKKKKKEKKMHFGTATFLTKSETCRESLLLLPREKLPIAAGKRSQRKEKKRGELPPFPVHGHPAQTDFSPCSVHFLNKPGDWKLEGKGKGERHTQLLMTRRQAETI